MPVAFIAGSSASVAPIASASGMLSPRRSPRTSRKINSAAAAFTPASLFTTPDMNDAIGWNATSRPAATASHSLPRC